MSHRSEYDEAGKRFTPDGCIPLSATFESDGAVECDANDGGTSNWHLIPKGARYYLGDFGECRCLECDGLVAVEG